MAIFIHLATRLVRSKQAAKAGVLLWLDVSGKLLDGKCGGGGGGGGGPLYDETRHEDAE
jgi:hypothetical protein